MLYLSETSNGQSRATALRILIDNSNRILSHKSAPKADIKGAALSLVAFDWAPLISDGAGSGDLNSLFRLLRDGVIPPYEYIICIDIITCATDGSVPLQHKQWRIWHALIVRFLLFEIAPIQDWVLLRARLDFRGIRAPGCANGTPFVDFTNAGWGIGRPDMIPILWQAARTLITEWAAGSRELTAPDSREFRPMIISPSGVRHRAIR